jgi:2,3-bisphosphoglycerate-independent phosphoglycerate mutase
MFPLVVLVILDGWGLSENRKGNVLFESNLPTIKKLDQFYPRIALQASGISVGLPWGEPGNSEVGHMSLGTGTVNYQNMPRITMAIQNGEFFKNKVFIDACNNVKENKSSLHLMGLLGKGGIHSSTDHLYALIELAKKEGVENLFLHIFTDGRDSSPTSGVESVRELKKKLLTFGLGEIATIGGRYFGMDRNNNWDRIKKSYDTMTKGIGNVTEDPEKYLEQSYANGIYDEYTEPALIIKSDGETKRPVGQIKDNDSVIFFNFREDRARQITKAFVLPGFMKFESLKFNNLFFGTMVQYEDDLPAKVAFQPITIKNPLGEIISSYGLKQLRIAETEKFAHVTYFFNGGNEEPFPGEDRVIIPSKPVPSFDKAPEMSAKEITDKVCIAVNEEKYSFILVNYANADIVGHTGNEKACIEAVEAIDECLGRLIKSVILKNGHILITADHGNVEEVVNTKTGEIDTEHSINPVPLWYVTAENHHSTATPDDIAPRVAGLLSDIAPTILDILQIEKPKEMTGESLLEFLK